MNCPYCGSANPEGSAMCASCGQPLAVAPPVAPAPPAPPEAYAQPPAPVYAPPPAPPAAQGYAPPQYAQPQVVAAVPVKNHLVMAILATLFCCLPFGVVGIIFATQVNSKLAAGDFAGAQKASKNAALWSWLAIGGAVLLIILYVVLFVVLGVSEYTSSM